MKMAKIQKYILLSSNPVQQIKLIKSLTSEKKKLLVEKKANTHKKTWKQKRKINVLGEILT